MYLFVFCIMQPCCQDIGWTTRGMPLSVVETLGKVNVLLFFSMKGESFHLCAETLEDEMRKSHSHKQDRPGEKSISR